MATKKQLEKWADTDVEHVGTKITLPADPRHMALRDAVDVLEQKIKDEEQMMDVHEIIDAFPLDALVALNHVMKEKFGWTSATSQKIESFFGTQEIRPDLITVKTGPKIGDSVQVLSGMFKIPNVENPINTRFIKHKGRACLVLFGEARKREFHIIKELAEDTRRYLRDNSIYKGKSIQLHVNSSGKLSENAEPQFMETDNIDIDQLVLNEKEIQQVEATLWAPIINTELCIKHKIPLNRGILLEGTYGTGKTMTAHVTSRICVENGWTYIMLDDVRGLADALVFAQRYQPAVVFAEDVDRVVGQRDQAGNDLLNTIDGVLTKNAKVITVLTTNHVENLETAMLRPGRLDAVISVRAPEPEAVKKLIRIYAQDLLAEDENLDAVANILAGQIPATIREVVERSKLGMIYRGAHDLIENDLIISANNMKDHLELLAGKKPEDSAEERLGKALRAVIATENLERVPGIESKVDEIYDNVV